MIFFFLVDKASNCFKYIRSFNASKQCSKTLCHELNILNTKFKNAISLPSVMYCLYWQFVSQIQWSKPPDAQSAAYPVEEFKF